MYITLRILSTLSLMTRGLFFLHKSNNKSAAKANVFLLLMASGHKTRSSPNVITPLCASTEREAAPNDTSATVSYICVCAGR